MYDAHAVWTELRNLYPPVEREMLSLYSSTENMHPRVLTALLRLSIEGRAGTESRATSQFESDALAVVRCMFSKASRVLKQEHPVRLLCSLPADVNHTPAFLDRFLRHTVSILR